jgi:hypothetical protein
MSTTRPAGGVFTITGYSQRRIAVLFANVIGIRSSREGF